MKVLKISKKLIAAVTFVALFVLGDQAWPSQNPSEHYDHARVHYNGSPLNFEEWLDSEKRQLEEFRRKSYQGLMVFGLCSMGVSLYFGGLGNACPGISAFFTGVFAYITETNTTRNQIRNRLGYLRDFYDV